MALGDWFLNGTKLDPANFNWSESYDVVGGDERTLSGVLHRDIVARKLTVGMSWEYLPETSEGSYHAYSDLRALGTNAGTVVLIRPVGTSTGTEQFKVFCSTPSGEVAFRSAGTVFWNADFQVVEA